MTAFAIVAFILFSLLLPYAYGGWACLLLVLGLSSAGFALTYALRDEEEVDW